MLCEAPQAAGKAGWAAFIAAVLPGCQVWRYLKARTVACSPFVVLWGRVRLARGAPV